MKYYRITTYTTYCGEEIDHYMAIPDDENIEDSKYMARICDILADDAMEWWDDYSQEDYEDDYEAYLGDCGYDIEEISEKEYLADCGKE